MGDVITVSGAARKLSDTYHLDIRPRDISQLFYERELRDDLCPIVGGRRMIPADYLEQIAWALSRNGKLTRTEKS